MPFDADDMAAFINPDMPGYVLASINGVDVGGLFRGPYQEAFGMVGGNSPSILCAASDVAAVVGGNPVTVNSVSYQVEGVPEVDLATGFTRLSLGKTT